MLAYETEALATEAEAETKAFSVDTEAKTKTFSLQVEARPRRLKFQSRRDQAEALYTAPRDGLETEASRPRPHPCQFGGLEERYILCIMLRASLRPTHMYGVFWQTSPKLLMLLTTKF